MTPSLKEAREALEPFCREGERPGFERSFFVSESHLRRAAALYDSLLTAEAEANVLAIRSWDSPGFDACVKAERERLAQREAGPPINLDIHECNRIDARAKLPETPRLGIMAARLLLQNSIACAEQHHGSDFSKESLPGWLADSKRNIDNLEAALASPSPSALTDALDALVIHADAYLAGECTKPEFSEAVERARKHIDTALKERGVEG